MTLYPKIFVAGHRGMVGSAIVRHLLVNSHPAERLVTRIVTVLILITPSTAFVFPTEML